MILETNKYNNGYGCSCCRQDYKSTEWIEEKDMISLVDIINYIYDGKWNGHHEANNHLNLLYEKDGKVLYGFDIDYRRKSEDVFILIGEEKYRVYLDYSPDSHADGKSREEMLKIAKVQEGEE